MHALREITCQLLREANRVSHSRKNGDSAEVNLRQSRPRHRRATAAPRNSPADSRGDRSATALLILALLLIPASPAAPAPQASTEAQLAQRPYMGWSSWSFYRDHPTEAIVKAQADALVANGLPPLGYRYVNIDDGWSDGFDAPVPPPLITASR